MINHDFLLSTVFLFIVFDNESSDSDNYSPVCSDAEEESPALPSSVIDDGGATDEFENEKSKDSEQMDTSGRNMINGYRF